MQLQKYCTFLWEYLHNVDWSFVTVVFHLVSSFVQLIFQQLQFFDVIFVHLRLVANQLKL